MLEKIFKNLLNQYESSESKTEGLWKEVEAAYSSPSRHYHTLAHLQMLIDELSGCRNLLDDWNTILFAVFYHDITYKITRSDNEQKSAQLAIERMTMLRVPDNTIRRCKNHIIATKAQGLSDDGDTNFFTDADLSILGYSPQQYLQYKDQIRKEYKLYPRVIYSQGRKKTLAHFLAMERIFKTDYFFYLYETQARDNLKAEIDTLS